MNKPAYYRLKKVADNYDRIRFESNSGRLLQSLEIQAIKRRLSPHASTMELACGTGRLLKTLREDKWNVTGVDQSAEMLKAGGILNTPYTVVADVHQLPFVNSSMDAAYSFRFTNHFPDLLPFFTEVNRTLRSDGNFVFDSMRWSPLIWNSRTLGGRNYPVKDTTIRLKLEQAGFKVKSIDSLFPVSPFILGRLPFFLVKIILFLGKFIPARIHPIAVWHAKKT